MPAPVARTQRLVRAAMAVALALCLLGASIEAALRWGHWVSRDDFAATADALPVLDRAGQPLGALRPGGVDRRWVPLREVSPHFLAAVIAAEDRRFYAHGGVSPRDIARALTRNLLPGARRSGASTITQQTVKLVYGRPHGAWSKLVEALRAVALERTMRKDEVLTQYVNRLPFGNGIVGVARAAEVYFGKSPAALTVAEAALLAGIPQAPSATEPQRHLARALRRRDFILGRMRDAGTLTAAECEAARREPATVRVDGSNRVDTLRFIEAAAQEALRTRRGTRTALHSTLHSALQSEAATLVRTAVDRFAARGAFNGAAVVLANDSAEVLAYVAAARFGEAYPGGAMDLLRAPRQPGSLMKPIVYEMLFARGATAATTLADVQDRLRGARGVSFFARDYDGRERGPVTARRALASSLNLAALDAAAQVGAADVVTRLRSLGLRADRAAEAYGEAVVLGGVDVTALQMAAVYATLARGGTLLHPTLLPRRTAPSAVRVMDAAAAAMTLDVLRDPAARRQGFGDDLVALAPGVTFALKTGTSSNWRDAWAAVSSSRFTVVLWLGDPASAPMAQVSGFEAAAPTAVRVLAAAERLAPEVPAVRWQPEMESVALCADSGHRAGPACSHVVVEQVPSGRAPQTPCTAHDAEGRVLLSPRYAGWMARHRPTGYALSDDSEREGAVEVSEPRDGAVWVVDARRPLPAVELVARVQGRRVLASWEVDGAPFAGNTCRPTAGTHRFVAVVGTRRSAVTTLRVEMVGTPRPG